MGKVKVAQCWDDGVVNDIRVIEILRKYGAKATFNLNPGFMRDERIQPSWHPVEFSAWSHKGYSGGKIGLRELREIYGDFQVASHCWKHECADQHDPEVFLKAAMDARHYLEDVFQRECPGFAWPCGRYTPETCKLMNEAGFAYGRTTKNVDDVLAYDDPMALHSNCHYQDPAFYQKYMDAKNGCGVFYFWGHSYEMLDSAGMFQQYEQKIRMISEDPDAEWIDVVDIVKLKQN